MTLRFSDFLRETPNAVLLKFDNKEVWVPKSICEVDVDDGTVQVEEWFAIKNELENET